MTIVLVYHMRMTGVEIQTATLSEGKELRYQHGPKGETLNAVNNYCLLEVQYMEHKKCIKRVYYQTYMTQKLYL